VDVALLGPLEVTGPDGRVLIGAAKERLVLALLILRADAVVSRDALVDALWGDEPPATAAKTLQGYVARVRRALEAAGLAGVLATRDPGYVLVSPGSIDAVGFEREVAAGRRSLVDGDATAATAALTAALALWRGDALLDCRSGGWAAAEAIRLDELRLSTVEDRVDADLMLGQHVVLVAELEALVVRYPLRERLWAALMLALYRAGRQPDALRAYQRARAVLIGELGLEPSAHLRELDASILAADPGLDVGEPNVIAASAPVRDQAAPAIPLPDRIARASSVTFVGRSREREALEHAFKAVADGGARVMLISGEPGIGKTSLSAAFALDAFTSGASVLYGRCDDDLGIPYQPWAEVLTHLVGHAPDEVLAAHVEARGNELARLAPDLVDRTGVGGGSSSDAESERYLLFGAVADLLARVSVLAPMVLVLDDLHWADRPTLQLLRHIVSATAPRRLLVIGTFRDSDIAVDHPLADLLASLHREPDVQRLALSGLDDDELLALVDATARHATTDGGFALRDSLMVETDGNPFFVGEMLRHLLETGSFRQDDQGDRIGSPDLRASGLPVSIREIIGRRVTRLGGSTHAALSFAAVIGRDFDVELLGPVAALDEDTLVDLCDRAVAAAVLTEGNRSGRYTFAHALIEHALYDDLPAGGRERAHRVVAEALEHLCGDDPGERIGELAFHWAQASQPQNAGKAIAYAQRAGDRALAQLAPEEGIVRYRDALALLDRVSPDDPRCRAELLVGLGEAQRQTGDPDHRETLLEAGRLADEIGATDLLVRAALRNNRGWMSIGGATDHERVELLTRALERLGPSDSADRARLLALLCIERTWDADFDERVSLATEAVDIARRIGDKAALVDAIRLSHESIAMPQTLDLRLRWNAEACELADELGDPTARLHANDFRCYAAGEAGDVETMRTAYAIFESESARIGQPQNWWQIAYNRASQSMLKGDLDAAEQAANEAVTLGTAAGFPEDAFTFFAAQLVALRWMQGRADEMVPLVEQALQDNPGLEIYRAVLAFAKSFHDPRHEVRHMLDLEVARDFAMYPDSTWLAGQALWAGAIARSGHRAAAALLYERLLPWESQFASAHLNVEGSVALYLGLLARTLGHDDAAAEQWFEQALAMHEAMEAPFFISWTQVAWGELLADRNRPGDAKRARALADTALVVGTRLGFGYVERDARALLARM
jgi:DNA-binding SARP family transcriptional activator